MQDRAGDDHGAFGGVKPGDTIEVHWVHSSCAKVDINSLHEWAEDGNAFNENHSHGVRQLVTAPELMSTIGN